jgi:amino acid transporter
MIQVGLMLLCVVTAMGEMAIMYPVSGGFFTLVGRFVDDNVALANGWVSLSGKAP